MKLTNARKFRRAFTYLEGYLGYCGDAGISEHDEWCGEVEAVRKEVDPKDWQLFDARIAKLEKLGLGMYRVREAFDNEEVRYQLQLDNVFDEIWEATKRK